MAQTDPRLADVKSSVADAIKHLKELESVLKSLRIADWNVISEENRVEIGHDAQIAKNVARIALKVVKTGRLGGSGRERQRL